MIVGGSKCAFANGDHGPCRGRLEWHHCVTKNRLKRHFRYGALWDGTELTGRWVPANRYNAVPRSYFPDRIALTDILGDTRNRVFLCSLHHELVTNGRVRVDIPDSCWEFADEFGLRGALENDLVRQAA